MSSEEILDVVFYKGASGREPVRHWLKEMVREDRKIIGDDVQTVQFRWPLGMPLVRKMDQGLWEVRSRISKGCIARLFFTVDNREMILLHGIMKKTDKTPQSDIVTAKRRRDNWMSDANK
ncbi:MAG: type II toxin-antitoxin system RelE/ParE family toxin [Mariprofundus sp.]